MSAPSDAELSALAMGVGVQLQARRWRLASAESCTGGWLGKALTDAPGSSAYYVGGVVAYSNALKCALLDVAAETLAANGAVSEPIAQQMALGALKRLDCEVAAAITGIAGPGGAQPGKPVGLVWFGWAWRTPEGVQTRCAAEHFAGDREAIRRYSVARALQELERLNG